MSNKNNRDRAPSQGGAARGAQNDGSETDRAGMRQWSWDFLSSTLRARLHNECAQGDGEGGGRGFRMGSTCTAMADSCQCMTKPTAIL